MTDSPTGAQTRDDSLRTLFSLSPDPIVLHDGEARIRDVNDAAVDEFGYTREQLLSMEVFELESEHDRGELRSLWDGMDRGDRETIEGRCRRADGSTLPTEISIKKTTVDGAVRFLALCRDITDRKAFEQQLAAGRGSLEEAIDGLPYPFYVLDVDDYTVEHANSEATVGEGDTCYEVTHCRELPCDEGDDPIACPIADVLESGESTTVEHVHYDEQGRERIFEVLASPILDDDGDIVKIAESNIDVTERVNYERRLEAQRDDLEVLNQVVRHDIRNDMTVIHGRANLLESHVEEDGLADLKAVQEAAENAIELTRTARDLSETMLSTEADLEAVSLKHNLLTPVENARSAFENAVIILDDQPPNVRVRANDLLEAVFRNLVQNAIVHNDKTAPCVRISTTVEEGSITVSVADNGPGVPDEQKEAIFQKSHKGIDSPGTGLGLYLVQTLVDRYGGEVRLTDNDPEGSVFAVELPLADG